MTDKDFHNTIRRVKKITAKWITCCGLRMWQKVDFVYHRDVAEMAGAGRISLDDEQRDVAGRASVNWEYKTATIHLNIDKLSGLNDDDIDYTIRHEICHLLVAEMREWSSWKPGDGISIKHEERVVTDLACVLGWVRIAGQNDPRVRNKKKR